MYFRCMDIQKSHVKLCELRELLIEYGIDIDLFNPECRSIRVGCFQIYYQVNIYKTDRYTIYDGDDGGKWTHHIGAREVLEHVVRLVAERLKL